MAGVVNVLVVDDDERIRAALRRLMLASGIRTVTEAASADDAEAALRQWLPTVVLADLMLPQARHGLALVRLVSRSDHLAVVALNVSQRWRQATLAAGADYALPPDCEAETIARAVQATIASMSTGRPGNAPWDP